MQTYLISGDIEVQINVLYWVRQRGIRLRYQHAFKSEWDGPFAVVSFLTDEDELRWGRSFVKWIEEAPYRMYRKFYDSFGQSPYSAVPQVPLDSEIILS